MGEQPIVAVLLQRCQAGRSESRTVIEADFEVAAAVVVVAAAVVEDGFRAVGIKVAAGTKIRSLSGVEKEAGIK